MSRVRAWLRFVRVSQFHEQNCSHDFTLYSVVEFLKALKVGRSLEDRCLVEYVTFFCTPSPQHTPHARRVTTWLKQPLFQTSAQDCLLVWLLATWFELVRSKTYHFEL